MLVGGIFTAAALMLLLAIGLYLIHRDIFYLLWFGFLASLALNWANHDGLIAYVFSPSRLETINQLAMLASITSMLFSAVLVTQLFRVRHLSIWLHRIFITWATLVAALGASGLVFQWYGVVGWLLISGVPVTILCCVIIAIQMTRGVREAILHGPLFLTYAAAVIYYLLPTFGWAYEYTEATLWIWQVAGVLNVVSLQIAVLLRARQSQREAVAEREHLNQALIFQNEHLEDTVAQRTQSLNAALEAAQLREAEQRQFIAMLSHEVRSPMAVIGATAELLAVHLHDQPHHRPLLQRVQRGVARLSNFFDNCLTQDRVYSHSYTLDLVDTDMVELITMARESAEALSDAHQLVMELPAVPVHVSGDAVLLRIAVMNLLVNAFKFSPSGSTVTLHLTCPGSNCRIEVQDQGPGIPEKDRSVIFQKYRRGGAAERTPGAGLGLAIVKGIVDLHHGSVHVESAPGGGSLFVVELPCLPAYATQMQ
jgi:signal transduction histidine kinase